MNELETVQTHVSEQKLKMKLVDTEFTGSRAAGDLKFWVYFTAQKRVDFRTLVRQLARTYKCRIEMRQISMREHAARLGGINTCKQCRVPCLIPFCHKSRWGGCFYDKDGKDCGKDCNDCEKKV